MLGAVISSSFQCDFWSEAIFRFFLVSERRQVVGSTRRGKGAVLPLSSTPRKKTQETTTCSSFLG